VEPAARAVEETAQALVLAQEEQKSAIRAATEERNAVIKDADRKRRLADEAVARAVDAAKSGRVLSGVNESALRDALDVLDVALGRLREVVARQTPNKQEEG